MSFRWLQATTEVLGTEPSPLEEQWVFSIPEPSHHFVIHEAIPIFSGSLSNLLKRFSIVKCFSILFTTLRLVFMVNNIL